MKVSDQLSDKQQEVKEIVQKYKEIFTEKPGKTTLVQHKIVLTDNEPIRSKPYAIPYNCRESLNKDINDMLEMCIIKKMEIPYASSVVIVTKRTAQTGYVLIIVRSIK